MLADLVLKNARLVTPQGVVLGGVAVTDGKIVAIANDAELPSAHEVVDCGDKAVLPGLVDPHVHMGGGAPYEQNCLTECASAAAGGVTTILQYYRSPSRSFLETFPQQRAIAEQTFFLDTAFHLIISGLDQAMEIPEYAKRFGVTSFKFYMGGYAPGNPVGIVTTDDGVLYSAMERIRELGPHAWCMVHCEDQGLVMLLTDRMKRSGQQDLPAYTASRPAFCEEQDVLRALWLAELLNCPLYIPHVTIGRAIDAVLEARRRGVRVVLETCPHYLALTADDPRLASGGTGVGKVSPPLRDKPNQERLWWGLTNGHIQTIGSDHVPICKSGQALWEERPGFAGMATLLPALLTYGVLAGRLTLERVAELTALNPGRIFGFFPPKGAVAVGFDADLVVVDLEKEAVVGPETTHSRYTSAFEGVPLRGWPVLTIRRGEVVFKDGQVLGRPGTGRILERRKEPGAQTG